MNIFGNKGEEKMKKTEGYIVKELEDEYIVLPVGERTEEVNEVISLSETAGLFISMQIRQKILKNWHSWLETNMG